MPKSYPKDVKDRVLDAAWRSGQWRLVATHNGVAARTARGWVDAAGKTDSYTAEDSRRGGAYHRKMLDNHVEFLLERLADTCDLTLEQMKGLLHDEFELDVCIETICRVLDGACFSLKMKHRDSEYRNIAVNKEKRAAFCIKLLHYLSAGKKIVYMDETNFNLWCSRNYGWSARNTRAVEHNIASKGRNIHVIAAISRDGLEYSESRFGSFKSDACNDFIRRMLRDISQRSALSDVVVVVDNAPCHTAVDAVFEEEEFAQADVLRLGSYSPMFNAIENVLSAYKAAVKRFMAANRQAIPTMTITEHRSLSLTRAAEDILPDIATAALCGRCIDHTFKFVSDAILQRDMQVGT